MMARLFHAKLVPQIAALELEPMFLEDHRAVSQLNVFVLLACLGLITTLSVLDPSPVLHAAQAVLWVLVPMWVQAARAFQQLTVFAPLALQESTTMTTVPCCVPLALPLVLLALAHRLPASQLPIDSALLLAQDILLLQIL